jgi:hypothetical protein
MRLRPILFNQTQLRVRAEIIFASVLVGLFTLGLNEWLFYQHYQNLKILLWSFPGILTVSIVGSFMAVLGPCLIIWYLDERKRSQATESLVNKDGDKLGETVEGKNIINHTSSLEENNCQSGLEEADTGAKS